jgi:hypothetical protein
LSDDETVVYLNPVKVLSIILLSISLAGVGWLGYAEYWNWRVGQPVLFAYAATNASCTGGSACVPIGVSANIGGLIIRKYGIPVYASELGWITNYHLAFVAGLIIMAVCLSLVLIRRFGRTETE